MTASSLIVRRAASIDPRDLAAASRAALDVAIEGDAELWLARPSSDAIVRGAFQRSSGVDPHRGSGGPAVRVGTGSLWIALLLPRVDALVACDDGGSARSAGRSTLGARILNRHVRPILRALTKRGHLAHYFGRDWISVRHRPAAWIGFAHDATSGRAVIEHVVACGTRFDVEARASFRGKEPTTLNVDPASLEDAVVDAWVGASGRTAIDRGAIPRVARDDDRDGRVDPPWAATIDEAIGEVGAGPDAGGVFRVGGDVMVSRDALAKLEAAVVRTGDADLGALVDATLAAPRVALEGVRSLTTLRDVILAARAR